MIITKNIIILNRFPVTLRCHRLLATQTATKEVKTELEKENIRSVEWDAAIPYDQIPGPSKFETLRGFLPGGKYHNLSREVISKKLRAEYGDIVKIDGLFKQNDVVFVFNPDYYEKIYRNDGIWPSRKSLDTLSLYRHELRSEIYKETGSLITSNGKEWGDFRSKVNPVLMQPRTVKIYVPRMDMVTKKFINRIRKIRDPATLEMPDNFERELNTWSLEQISLVGLDTEMGLIGNESKDNDAYKLIDAVTTIFTQVSELEFKPSIWKYYQTPTFKRVMKAYDDLTDISLKYIEQAMERYKLTEKNDTRNENEKSVVERLIKIDKRVAIIMALEMFFAGVDTTTTTFTACMLALSKSPEKQEKLRNEILKEFPDPNSSVTEEKLNKIPYLRAVIKEAIRMNPVVHELSRTSNIDFVVGKYQIPKGTDMLMFNSHYFKKSDHFSEPNKFIPERWMRTAKDNNKNPVSDASGQCPVTATKSSNPFVYLPFGFGTRMCVGKRLVEMELEILLVNMVRNFHIEYNYDEKDVFELQLIYTPAKPLKFKLTDVKN